MLIIDAIYLVTVVLLTLYGANALVSVVLYVVHCKDAQMMADARETPDVTIQLPVFNEVYVLERLLDAVTKLRYPREHLQIQVLDDSTDATTELAERLVAGYVEQGLRVDLLHREDRAGFKGGALREAFASATGEFIAIFDADFVPEQDFLERTIPHFLGRKNLGLVQTRWGHINGDYSGLTRAEAIALDGHFVVEQTARNRSGLFMNFNGTAGVWRKACIAAAGGWHDDTLCEDLDLSYRAQMQGWEFLYLPDVAVPAELPPQINAFKRQQFRWAKGSTQTALKLGGTLLRATEVPWYKRLQGLLHLTSYLVHPLMVMLLLLTVPFLLVKSAVASYVGFLSVVSVGPPLVYAISQWALYRGQFIKRLAAFPLLVLLATGVAWNNSRAVWEAIAGRKSQFMRTPKFHVEGPQDKWDDNPYALPLDWNTVAELVLVAYAALAIGLALRARNYFVVPFLFLYMLSFAYVATLGVVHSASARRVGRRRGAGDSLGSTKPRGGAYSFK